MQIRPERPADFAALSDFVREAFRTARHADGDEAEFVDRLRAGPAYIPELALVGERDGQIVGHIMFTWLDIAGARASALLLAPLCIALPVRGMGLGTALAREGLRRARFGGHGGVFVVGDPAFYRRLGFATSAGVVNANGFAAENFMALELIPGALAGVSGSLRLPE